MKRSGSKKDKKGDIKRSDSRSSKKEGLERSDSKSSRRSFRSKLGRSTSKTREPSNHDGPQDGSYDGGHESTNEYSDQDHHQKRRAAGYRQFSEEKIGSLPKHLEMGTTGSPFIRPPSRTGSPVQYIQPGDEPSSPLATPHPDPQDPFVFCADNEPHDDDETIHVERCKAKKQTKESADIPVGVSRDRKSVV